MSDAAQALIAALSGVDTGTLCNAMILLDPQLRGKNYTLEPVIAATQPMRPFTGFALTAKIVSCEPSRDAHEVMLARRFAYYRYLSQAPRPSLVVMQDAGSKPGVGCIWGEINASIHKGLGLVGAVTNGAVRDLDAMPDGFQLLGGKVVPGTGFAHLVEFGTPVEVFGLAVSPGDLVHADRHGCVVVPPRLFGELPAAMARVAKRESALLGAVNAPGFDRDKLIEAWKSFEAR